ncbi:unnamed protein product [Closterium sp. Yama58-4]|nr:unnamed protein product [Closterium sp. Yama58-4]
MDGDCTGPNEIGRKRKALTEIIHRDDPGRVSEAVRGVLSRSERRSLRREFRTDLNTVLSLDRKTAEATELSSAGQPLDGGLGETAQSGGPLALGVAQQLHQHHRKRGAAGGERTPGGKEKRTPKANTTYIHPDFLSAADKLPPPEKGKSKSSSQKRRGGRGRAERSAQAEDAEKLKLHDYHTVIKNPMDLGTINTRLKASGYQHPDELHNDVLLVWSNAMTYNGEGNDVYHMAAELKTCSSKGTRRDKSEVLELEKRLQKLESQLVASTKAQQQQGKAKGGQAKPRAADTKKRDMTFAEKQKLSVNLGKLPPEKLDRIVQIISERNPDLSQNADEIELDIDSLDNETLWELERYVANCMKSKSKRKKIPLYDTVQPKGVDAFPASSAGDLKEGEDSIDIGDEGPLPAQPAGPSKLEPSRASAGNGAQGGGAASDSSGSSGSSDDSSSSGV